MLSNLDARTTRTTGDVRQTLSRMRLPRSEVNDYESNT